MSKETENLLYSILPYHLYGTEIVLTYTKLCVKLYNISGLKLFHVPYEIPEASRLCLKIVNIAKKAGLNTFKKETRANYNYSLVF